MDRSRRVEALRVELARAHLDALLLTKLVNIRWLTGFTGSSGLAVIDAGRLLLVTDARYGSSGAQETSAAGVAMELEVTAKPGELLPRILAGARRLGLEADDVSWSRMREISDEWIPSSEPVPTRSLVEALRAVKEPGELERIRAAGEVASASLAAAFPLLAQGATEVEVAVEIEARMRLLGAEAAAFPTVVASGPGSADPHHDPGSRRIAEGDLVVIDLGAIIDGYCSDMTRTFAVGEPDELARRLLAVTAEAQAAALAVVRAGVAGRDVDRAARSVISQAGWGDAFLHPTGHGVGMEVHEGLRLSEGSDDTLAAGHAVTVEPGIYLPGLGGARIEDTVEVTADGCRPLTSSSLPRVVT